MHLKGDQIMSNLTYDLYPGLNDSAERDLMRKALSARNSHSTSATRKAFGSVVNGARAVSTFIGDVAQAMNESREHDASITRYY